MYCLNVAMPHSSSWRRIDDAVTVATGATMHRRGTSTTSHQCRLRGHLRLIPWRPYVSDTRRGSPTRSARARWSDPGCPAGVAFQHAALLVTQLVADHRPAPVRAPTPVQQPRDGAGLIIDANNAAYVAAEAADLVAQAAPPPGAARDAARAERTTQYQAGLVQLAKPRGLRRLMWQLTRSLTWSSLRPMRGGISLVGGMPTGPWRLLGLMQRHHRRRRAPRCVLPRRLRPSCARPVVRCGGRPRAPP
eukprot:COSAG06_NODE_275_length_18581_cov_31.316145_4_plen_248_part_00